MRNTDIESQKAINKLDSISTDWHFDVTDRKDNIITGKLTVDDEEYISSIDITECFKNGKKPVSKCFMQCFSKIDIGDDLDVQYA
jgi:hypothetical protein